MIYFAARASDDDGLEAREELAPAHGRAEDAAGLHDRCQLLVGQVLLGRVDGDEAVPVAAGASRKEHVDVRLHLAEALLARAEGVDEEEVLRRRPVALLGVADAAAPGLARDEHVRAEDEVSRAPG